jgi:hypothetical protein
LLADRIADTSTTDWTLARALRTGRFWWIPAGYFCAFAYAVQVHQTKCLIEIGFPLLVIELGVAAMGAGLLLGSPITHRGSFI